VASWKESQLDTVRGYLLHTIRARGACLLALIDPDKQTSEAAGALCSMAHDNGVDAFLVGGSFLFTERFERTLQEIKAAVECPVIIMPGASGAQVHLSRHADAALLLSLVSGRNAEYLIGEHVRAALGIKRIGLETIPTGYILVESGRTTSLEWFSASRPIPADKPEIAMVHALAAEQLGMKMAYLDAGSGAKNPVPTDMVSLVAGEITIPLIVSGGLNRPELVRERVEAGAALVVIGSAFEETAGPTVVAEFADAAHIGPRAAL